MNEVEKKEIEEIMKAIDELWVDYPPSTQEVAEALYNAGYGKVEDYKKEIFALKTTLEDREYEVIELNKKVEKQELDNVDFIKQQAIKEFAKRLYDKYAKSCSEYYPEIIELTHKQLDDLLKEYGIGEE